MNEERTTGGGVETLDSAESLALLAEQPVGRVGFMTDAGPMILPVNHAVDDYSIVFRSGYGTKLLAAASESRVAFEADGFEPATRSGWSVLVRGVAESVYDHEVVERLDRLGLDTWFGSAGRDRWIRIHPDEITGRRLNPS